MAEKKKTLYHYTDPKSAAQIRKDGVIKPSASGAFGGNKVYTTSLNPSHGRKAIAKNNYDGVQKVRSDGRYWEVREKQGSVDSCIKVRVPERQVQKERDPAGRDIYTVKGKVEVKKK